MSRFPVRWIIPSVLLLAAFSAIATWQVWPSGGPAWSAENVQTRLSQTWGQFPLSFEVNQGQTDNQVDFVSRGQGYTLFLKPTQAVLALTKPTVAEQAPDWDLAIDGPLNPKEPKAQPPTVLTMQLVGADASAMVTGLNELTGNTNYLIGNDPAQWRTNIPNFAKVQYQEVYPGVDLLYYGNQRQLEYDFLVAPGADFKAIDLEFKGTEQLSIDEQGSLSLQVDGGRVTLLAPIVYQDIDGFRNTISGHYVLRGDKRVGFKIGQYDPTRTLVIDPVLVYSTYLGGGLAGDGANAIAVDSSGNAYITGTTSSADFPTLNPVPGLSLGGVDLFVAKLDPTGSTLIYSTYLGGSSTSETANAIAVDGSGNAYVTGITNSTDFPTFPDPGALQDSLAGSWDAFLTKLTPTGTLAYSTCLGGSESDFGNGVAVDSIGNAYLTGVTRFDDFPTKDPLQTKPGFLFDHDAFVTKVNSTGTGLVYSTYLGGTSYDEGRDIAVDGTGSAFVTGKTASSNFLTENPLQPARAGGTDAFVAQLTPDGSSLVFSTYLGGIRFEEDEEIALDGAGNIFVVGRTDSVDFPTTPGVVQGDYAGDNDAFLAKLAAGGSALVYATYLGGAGFDGPGDVAVNSLGNAYVTGTTRSTDFPTANPLQGSLLGFSDVFVAKLDTLGSKFEYSTYLGGGSSDNGGGIAVDSSGDAYVAGSTNSLNFPVEGAIQDANAGFSDAFVSKIRYTLDPFAWGTNANGQLAQIPWGPGSDPNPTPTPMLGLTDAIKIEGGGNHTLVLKSDGTVWTSGNNAQGQLGSGSPGSPANRSQLLQVVGPGGTGVLEDIIDIAAGSFYNLALTSDGRVWAWGQNSDGQLGIGSSGASIGTPTLVVGPGGSGVLSGIGSISAGGFHSLALNYDGSTLWSWGANVSGQLGDNTTTTRAAPVEVSSLSLPVASMAGGWLHSLAVLSDGTVVAWGDGKSGQLGDGHTGGSHTHQVPVPVSGLGDVTAVAGGFDHSLALKSDGSAWGWGLGNFGQLGNGFSAPRTTPFAVSPFPGTSLPDFTAIAAGERVSLALGSDGGVWSWGIGNRGSLGNGLLLTQYYPVQVINPNDPSGLLSGVGAIGAGTSHSLALVAPPDVVDDTTPPILTLPATMFVPATSAAGAEVSFSVTATDDVDGDVPVECSPTSGTLFPMSSTLVNCSATDLSDNTGVGSFFIVVIEMLGWWRGESNANDWFGINNGNLGTAPTNPTFGSGMVGQAFSIDGWDDFVVVPSSDSLSSYGDHTISFWINWRSSVHAGYQQILAKHAPGSGRSPGVWSCPTSVNNTGTVSGLHWKYVPVVPDPATPPGGFGPLCVGPEGEGSQFNLNQWYHIAGIKEGTTLKILVNGQQVGDTYPVPQDFIQGLGNFYIGATGFRPFDGLIDEVRFHNYGLSAGAVQAIYSGEVDTPPVVSVPSDIIAEATGPSGASVDYGTVTATDDPDIPMAVSCDALPGSVFNLGATVVTCLTTTPDAAGSVGVGRFTVTVQDTTGPELDLPDVVEPASGFDGAIVDFTASGTDLVAGDVPADCVPPAGSLFPLLITDVDCTASDDLDDGLVSWWPAEGDAADIEDDNSGTLVGGESFGQGVSGQAFVFNSVGDYVQVDDPGNLEFTDAMSVGAWIFPTGPSLLSGAGGILSKEGEYLIARFNDGTIRWAFGKPGWAWTDTGFVAPVNQWTHVAVVYDAGVVRTYANGSLVHTFEGTGSIVDVHPFLNDVRIGVRLSINAFFRGRIDEVKIFGRALSGPEILPAFFTQGSVGVGAFTVTVELPALEVDAKPGNEKNTLNLSGRGVLPVGIMGNAVFDVTQINLDSLRMRADLDGSAEVGPAHEGGHTPHDINNDGYIDLKLHFRYRPMGIGLEHIIDGVVYLILTGELNNGLPIEGSTFVTLRPIAGTLIPLLASAGGPPPIEDLPPGLLKRAKPKGGDEDDDPDNSGNNGNGKGNAKGHDKDKKDDEGGADPDPEAAGSDPDPNPEGGGTDPDPDPEPDPEPSSNNGNGKSNSGGNGKGKGNGNGGGDEEE